MGGSLMLKVDTRFGGGGGGPFRITLTSDNLDKGIVAARFIVNVGCTASFFSAMKEAQESSSPLPVEYEYE